jgi:hypothetical protein
MATTAQASKDRRMIRALKQWLAPANPARELALIGAEKRRREVREVARQIRDELGLPPLPALDD